MSWSSPLRVLGVCGVWLAVQTGCGGNPAVSNGDPGTDGGTSSGGTGTGVGAGGSFVIGHGGEGDTTGEGGAGATPSTFVCGNKELEPGEFCDDGNTTDGDGCSGDCKSVNPDYDCSEVGKACVQVVICGNGTLEGEEACDDGNTEDDDGCSFDCGEEEAGWVCIRPGKPCVEKPECGNGVRDRGEACDDGDKLSGDGCSDMCRVEPSYYCPVPGQDCVQQECGDGTRVKGEECDDGNLVGEDGCAANCKVETGWHCNVNGCKPECGDGLKKGAEACDDGNAIGGDGCSAACKIDPYFNCTNASPSVCTPKPKEELCGNNSLDPIYSGKVVVGHEVCDPPNVNGCNATCDGVTVISQPAKCNNGIIEVGETCDPPMVGMGCDATCKVETGFTCTQPGVCRAIPRCGDGVVNAGEDCDDKNSANGDGCSSACKVEGGYTCVGLQPSVCVKPVCGNGAIEPNEQCDDGNANTMDGCNACAITNGWACPTPGAACITKCGDGIKLGLEACDDGNKVSGDGCNAGCKVEPGFKCPTQNQKCVASVCGDGVKDTGEGCDDGGKCSAGTNKGNNCTADAQCPGTGAKCIPVAGDGCGPICQPEPTVTVGPNPTVNVVCGDGLKTGTEECDDGNKVDGDGCEDDCKVTKPGWQCSGKLTLPKQLQMKVTYRDFKSAAANNGHPDFMYDNLGHVAAITGGVCTSATASSTDKTKCGHLDADGKPELISTDRAATGIRNADSFKLWYRDGNPTNLQGYHGVINTSTITSTLILNQTGGDTSEVYVFDSIGNQFYPINGQGQGNMNTEGIGCGNHGYKNHVDTNACYCESNGDDCGNKNYGFTTELRYFFQYKGGERLTFSGDDDVWVYVNGRVAVDIGGLHSQTNGQVVLGDDGNGNAAQDSNCSAHSTGNDPPDPGTDAAPGCLTTAERNNATDDRFGLTKGGVYEIALFHAERHLDASNFKLTLAGFLAPRSSCDTICGDGVIVGDEYCDDGAANSDTASAACNTTCTARAFCGDSIRQLPGEACDNGTNTDLYKTATSSTTVCAPGCKTPASCGDGTLQPGKEECDKGGANNNNAYGPNECRTDCTFGGYCGDGVPQAGRETCDLGINNGTSYGPNSCGYDCKPGRRCGDGIINAPDQSEKCDDGIMNGSISSHCSTTCTIVPYCGDGQKSSTEECDSGKFNEEMPDYGGCSDMCTWGPKCGDGVKDNPEEDCDEGANNSPTTYGGCTLACTLGPRCGDGVKQATESCDNGFNEDDYEDPSTDAEECGVGCMPPPYCGDNEVQPAYELCDDGTTTNAKNLYNGCNSKCDYGPYCGDGTKNGPESCDNGTANVAYAAKKGACSYDCEAAPYCGDEVRNGPEQCDLGPKGNTGAYGKCNEDCTFAPRCGDKNVDQGEDCDEGPTGGLTCLPTCKRRPVVQ